MFKNTVLSINYFIYSKLILISSTNFNIKIRLEISAEDTQITGFFNETTTQFL